MYKALSTYIPISVERKLAFTNSAGPRIAPTLPPARKAAGTTVDIIGELTSPTFPIQASPIMHANDSPASDLHT
jgi:hypothetical protein